MNHTIKIPPILEGDTSYKIQFPGPEGRRIGVDRIGLTLEGERVVPVMGEVHYTRVPRAFWRDTLLAMKAAGITIIASYVFWSHHEEEEGEFQFEGRRDLRSFIELCQELGFWVFLRIGPWCHGEVRYGGFPDWLVKKVPFGKRTYHTTYLTYVERLYDAVLHQVKGLNWESGGPIMALQVENEYMIRNKGGVKYVQKLKQFVLDREFYLPIYVLTGWPISVRFPVEEFLPFWGDYPATPWAQHTKPISRPGSFQFSLNYIPKGIGTDLLGNKKAEINKRLMENPYCLTELGVGNQITDHRRPCFVPEDGAAMSLGKVGSGAALPGYYMFTGGTNPPSKITSLQESRKTGYPNDLPRLSYDFHGPIGEMGDPKGPYHLLKNIHYALGSFPQTLSGGRLVVNQEKVGVDWAYRGTESEGFLFINNHNRYLHDEVQKDQCFTLEMEGGAVSLGPLDIAPGVSCFFPINFKVSSRRESLCIKSATLQPLGRMGESSDGRDFFFTSVKGVDPVFTLSGQSISQLEITLLQGVWNQSLSEVGEAQYLELTPELCPESPSVIECRVGGERIRIIAISSADALGFWKDQNTIFLGGEDTIFTDEGIRMLSESPEVQGLIWNHERGLFEAAPIITAHEQPVPSVTPKCEVIPWTPFDQIGYSQNEEPNNIILGGCSLDGISPLENGRVIYQVEQSSTLYLQGKRVARFSAGSGVVPLKKSVIKKIAALAPLGDVHSSLLTLEPPVSGAVSVEVEDARGHRSRLCVGEPPSGIEFAEQKGEYRIMLKGMVCSERCRDYRLYLRYLGDKAELRVDGRLVADHFNQGLPWMVSLNRICEKETSLNGVPYPSSLELVVFARNSGKKVYLEGGLTQEDLQKQELLSVEIKPLYQTIFMGQGRNDSDFSAGER